MKHQTLFSLKGRSKKIKLSPAAISLGSLRIHHHVFLSFLCHLLLTEPNHSIAFSTAAAVTVITQINNSIYGKAQSKILVSQMLICVRFNLY